MSSSISGKSVIVTGAASGLGLAIARRLAGAGARVMMADRNEAALEAESEALTEAGTPVAAFVCDLRQKLAVNNLLAAALDAHDRVDILVNANRLVQPSDPLASDDDALEAHLHQNVVMNMRISQAVARRMIQQAEAAPDKDRDSQTGAIINISSLAARRARPALLAHSVSAAALDQLTRTLALALAPHGIRVNAIAPGAVMGDALREALRQDPDLRTRLEALTPMGRIGRAEEVAEACLFLACGQSAYVTGHILTLDGGIGLVDPLTAPPEPGQPESA